MLQLNVMSLEIVMYTLYFLVPSFIEGKQENRLSLSHKVAIGIIQDEKYQKCFAMLKEQF